MLIYASSIFLLFVYLCIYFWIRIPNCIKYFFNKRLNIQLNSVRFLTDNVVVLSLYGIRTLSRLCSDRNIRSLVFNLHLVKCTAHWWTFCVIYFYAHTGKWQNNQQFDGGHSAVEVEYRWYTAAPYSVKQDDESLSSSVKSFISSLVLIPLITCTVILQ